MLHKKDKASVIRQVRAARKASGDLPWKTQLAIAKAEIVHTADSPQQHWSVNVPDWVHVGALVQCKRTGDIGIVLELIRKVKDDDLKTSWYRKAEGAVHAAWGIKTMVRGLIREFSLLDLTSAD